VMSETRRRNRIDSMTRHVTVAMAAKRHV